MKDTDLRTDDEMIEKARKALTLWNKMERKVANCDEHCDHELAPENCAKCFPSCDKARLALRDACKAFNIKVR